MTDFAKALLDPTSIYHFPIEVVNDNTLNFDQKIKVLHQWEYDARELETAEEENMPELAEEHDCQLSAVLDAINALNKLKH